MSFSEQVKAWSEKARKRTNYVGRTAALKVINIVREPTAKGGRMRIKTGFLRASGQARIGQMPVGPTRNESGRIYSDTQQAEGQPVEAVLLRWVPGQDRLYFGFTANYARWREYQDGFLRGGVSQWNRLVKEAVKEAKTKIR